MRRPGAAGAAIVGIALGALALPAGAAAHAQLEGTTPPRGTVVKTQPPAVVFRFDEPVEGNFGAVRVFDARGGRVDSGGAFHPGGDGPKLAVRLRRGLARGSYTATYRVVSADGHVVSGGFVFSVGRRGAPPRETVAQLAGGTGGGPGEDVGFGLARGIQYAALAVVLGGFAFLLAVWLPALGGLAGGSERWRLASEALARRLRRAVALAAGLGALAAAAGIALQGALAGGTSVGDALDPDARRGSASPTRAAAGSTRPPSAAAPTPSRSSMRAVPMSAR